MTESYGILASDTATQQSATSNDWMYGTGGWDNSYGAAMNLTSDPAWWQSIFAAANTQVGSAAIAGAGSMLGSYLTNQSADERADKASALSSDQFAQKLAQSNEQFYADLELRQGLLELQQAQLDDKIQTRARHNTSINTAPGQITKKVTFGNKQ